MHDQLTLPRPESANQRPAGVPCQVVPREGDGPVLRFGFTYRHLEALTRRAIRDHISSRGLDWGDRYEAAWGSAVECLFSAKKSEPVSSLDLLRAARRGLNRLHVDAMRDRGCTYGKGGSGVRDAPVFWRYWTVLEAELPQEAAADRAALGQVMARLSPLLAQAMLALAEHGGYTAAAGALDVPLKTFYSRVDRGRTAFLALWHEHEAPSRMWKSTPEFRQALHGQPEGREEQVAALTAVRDAFGGRAKVPGGDLLAALAAADPGRFGDWDRTDLSRFLYGHHVHRCRVEIRADGKRQQAPRGYRLEDVTAALADLAAGDALALKAAA